MIEWFSPTCRWITCGPWLTVYLWVYDFRSLARARLWQSGHSKNTWVRNWPGKGPLRPNSIPGQRWPGNQSTWHGMWPRAGSIWPHYLSKSAESWPISGSSLTRNGIGPQWTLFRVTLTRVFLEWGGRGFLRLSQTRELKMRMSDPTLSIKRWYLPKRFILGIVLGHAHFPSQTIVTYVDILSKSDVSDHFFWSEYRVNRTRFHSLCSDFSLYWS